MKSRILIWFRRDLRLADNSALRAAIDLKAEIIPVYIWSPSEENPWAPGAASKWWLHESLTSLSKDLHKRGSRLILKTGSSLASLQGLISETKATSVYWNRLYDPAITRRDEMIKSKLIKDGVETKSFNSGLLYEPWTLQTKTKKPYQVFTPFYNAATSINPEPAIGAAPSKISAPQTWPKSEPLESLDLLPRPRWDKKLTKYWAPGEGGASKSLDRFLSGPVSTYIIDRDVPELRGTSRLSPHLHFGEIGPRQIWSLTKTSMKETKNTSYRKSADWFLREIMWREFAHHVLFNFKHTSEEPLRSDFQKFPWLQDADTYQRWKLGKTGVPIVDAGMRELYETGWMHNRVRMIVASFLTKHLLISWLEGARWFWDSLVDADLSNNSMGWQWAGGCGADAAPYFRIFNPLLQGEKFDPAGTYVRKWVPEIAHIPNSKIHQPINPVIELKAGRDRALEAFEEFRGN